LTLELISIDASQAGAKGALLVDEAVNRVLVNECGRVAELVFEEVKEMLPVSAAVKHA
jgi:hypothetical protein